MSDDANWGSLARFWGSNCLNFALLAAHDPTDRDKVRGLGASWRGGGESDRVVREQPEQSAGQRTNPVRLLFMLLLVLLAPVSVLSFPSPSCPSSQTKLLWNFSSAHVTPSGAPSLRNS